VKKIEVVLIADEEIIEIEVKPKKVINY